MWGIADVVVVADVSGAPSDARVVLADCAISPRVAIATPGGHVSVASAADAPAKISIAKRGAPSAFDKLVAGDARTIMLPIAGASVSVPAVDAQLDELAVVGDAPETAEAAWLIVTPNNAAVTDASGTAILRDLPIGAHAITAWLPPRAGQPARYAHGTATVVGGELAEITLELAP
jgi:hypothetical protein